MQLSRNTRKRFSPPTYGFSLVICYNPITDKWLAVKEIAKNGGDWWVPGGGVKQGETFYDAGVRETMEEAGVHVNIKGVLRVEHSLVGDGSDTDTARMTETTSMFARMRVIFYAEPDNYEQCTPKSHADEESERAEWKSDAELRMVQHRGSELMDWVKYLRDGNPIYPLHVFQRESALVPSTAPSLDSSPQPQSDDQIAGRMKGNGTSGDGLGLNRMTTASFGSQLSNLNTITTKWQPNPHVVQVCYLESLRKKYFRVLAQRALSQGQANVTPSSPGSKVSTGPTLSTRYVTSPDYVKLKTLLINVVQVRTSPDLLECLLDTPKPDAGLLMTALAYPEPHTVQINNGSLADFCISKERHKSLDLVVSCFQMASLSYSIVDARGDPIVFISAESMARLKVAAKQDAYVYSILMKNSNDDFLM
eukprot:CAMPEP_0184693450 /NCGR_PEP_ID=MMETSP0313-20130426/1670_1 /TAXON_ID=2792 /ORGANISM="Porphyridium aerugineum, Strain SAG 1380-2" /LENGTH=420 /DNA_ID=CAMNT_0027151533 /DNA_START=147 /DNA_END=1410 /DNA_ORIENTATION=+